MKSLRIYLTAFIGICCLASCELDNYEGPDAKIHGGLYDIETNELVPQDIISGTVIEYIEHGYSNPQLQTMIVKTDGTYRNDLMFSNTYTIRPVRGNFVPIDEQEVKVKGDTQLDFKVKPYIRIKNLKIEKVGTKVVATFTLQQTTTDKVKKIGLYAHREPSVGEQRRSAVAEKTINEVTDSATQYTLEIDLPANSSSLVPGQQYYFRVGALIDVAESKPNYETAIRITI